MLSFNFSRVIRAFVLSIFLATLGISTSAAEALPASDVDIHGSTPTPTQPAFPGVRIPMEHEQRDQEAPKVNVRVPRRLRQYNPRGAVERARMLRKRGNGNSGGSSASSTTSERRGIVAEVAASKPSPWLNEIVHQVGEIKLNDLVATHQANKPTSYGAGNDEATDLGSGIKAAGVPII